MLPTKEEFLANGGLAPCSEAFNDECAICHADARRDEVEDPVKLPCNCKYTYCRECITYWLTSEAGKAKCPICKEKLFKTPNSQSLPRVITQPVVRISLDEMDTFGIPVQQITTTGYRNLWGLPGAVNPSATLRSIENVRDAESNSVRLAAESALDLGDEFEIRLEYLIDHLLWEANRIRTHNVVRFGQGDWFRMPRRNQISESERSDLTQLTFSTYQVLEGLEGRRLTLSQLMHALVTGVLGQFGVSLRTLREAVVDSTFDWNDEHPNATRVLISTFYEMVLFSIVKLTHGIAVWADRQPRDYETFGLPVQPYGEDTVTVWSLSDAPDPTETLGELGAILFEQVLSHLEIADAEPCEVRTNFLVNELISSSRSLMEGIHWSKLSEKVDLIQLVNATHRALQGLEGQRHSFGDMKNILFERMLEQLESSPHRLRSLAQDHNLGQFFQGEDTIGAKFCSKVLKTIAEQTRYIAVWADDQESEQLVHQLAQLTHDSE